MTREETLIWFGILVAVNLQTSFISPPFGASLYYLKGICPPTSPSARSTAASRPS